MFSFFASSTRSAGITDFSENVKFLGFHLESRQTWTLHMDSVCKKLNGAYYAILKLVGAVLRDIQLQLYYAIVYSHLSCGVVLWGSSASAGRAFLLQKRIIKLIFKLNYRESCRECFRKS